QHERRRDLLVAQVVGDHSRRPAAAPSERTIVIRDGGIIPTGLCMAKEVEGLAHMHKDARRPTRSASVAALSVAARRKPPMTAHHDTESQQLGPRVRFDGHTLLTGSCSWTDRTLVTQADWYPQRTMTPVERLRYYSAKFPLTEVDSTYYAPPAEQQAR